MKRLLLSALMCLMTLSMSAQKCAVLEFSGSKSISISDVDGISEMFMTYFHPSGYTLVERAQIDRVISEQGFQRSSITESQMVRLGKILNVSKVVVGKVSMLGGQYQVDVRVVDVETGNNVAFEGASFSGNYRTNVQNLAQKLAGKIAIRSQASTQRTIPKGYVDLGLPSGTLWKNKNESGVYFSYEQAMDEYGSKIPTKAQLIELKNECEWKWNENIDGYKGYRVFGPNGNYIDMPMAGVRDCNGQYTAWSEAGVYWSSTRYSGNDIWFMGFYNAYKIFVTHEDISCPQIGYTVRLVTR